MGTFSSLCCPAKGLRGEQVAWTHHRGRTDGVAVSGTAGYGDMGAGDAGSFPPQRGQPGTSRGRRGAGLERGWHRGWAVLASDPGPWHPPGCEYKSSSRKKLWNGKLTQWLSCHYPALLLTSCSSPPRLSPLALYIVHVWRVWSFAQDSHGLWNQDVDALVALLAGSLLFKANKRPLGAIGLLEPWNVPACGLLLGPHPFLRQTLEGNLTAVQHLPGGGTAVGWWPRLGPHGGAQVLLRVLPAPGSDECPASLLVTWRAGAGSRADQTAVPPSVGDEASRPVGDCQTPRTAVSSGGRMRPDRCGHSQLRHSGRRLPCRVCRVVLTCCPQRKGPRTLPKHVRSPAHGARVTYAGLVSSIRTPACSSVLCAARDSACC